MMLILDTNHVDALMFEHERRDRLVAQLEAATGHTVATTIIVVQEKFEGWLASINGKGMTAERQVPYYAKIGALVRFFAHWNVLPFDEAAAHEYNRLKQLRLGGVGTNDLKIAAVALCHNALVLTADSNFRRIPDLAVEDWLADTQPD